MLTQRHREERSEFTGFKASIMSNINIEKCFEISVVLFSRTKETNQTNKIINSRKAGSVQKLIRTGSRVALERWYRTTYDEIAPFEDSTKRWHHRFLLHGTVADFTRLNGPQRSNRM